MKEKIVIKHMPATYQIFEQERRVKEEKSDINSDLLS